MKSLIIIVSLLVSAECARTRTQADTQDCSNQPINEDDVELKPFGQNGMDNTEPEILKSVPHVKSQKSHDFRTSKNKENEPIESVANTDEGEKNEVKSLTNVDEMMKRAVANRDKSMENATQMRENMQNLVENLKEKARVERDNALKSVDERCRKAESMANEVMSTTWKNVTEIRMKANADYNREMALADEKLEKAAKEYDAAYEAANDKFREAREQIEEMRKLESNHHDFVELEKARQKRDTELMLAKERMEAAQQNYAEAKESKTEMKSQDKANMETEYRKEMNLYQETLEKVDKEWHKVLDAIPIGNEYETALENLVKELQQAQEKADSIFTEATEAHEKTLEATKMKKDKTNNLAKDGLLKLQVQFESIVEKANNQKINTSKNAWKKWKSKEIMSNEKLKQANAEFFNAKRKAIDEWRNAMQIVNEMKRKSTQKAKTENITPEKIVNQKNVQKRRVPRKKLSNNTAGKND